MEYETEWEKMLREAGAHLTDINEVNQKNLHPGRPSEDEYKGKYATLYLREDVLDWLRVRAKEIGGGMGVSKLVIQLARAEMKRQAEMKARTPYDES